MPVKKIQKKCINDKFYTKSEVSDNCIAIMQEFIPDGVLFIEPSAGSGSFSSKIQCYAYDIEPENENIQKQDFLLLENQFQGQICVFGNPPFGERNHLTNSFIRKSIDIGARYIAFILPSVYKKFTMQKVFPSEWSLITEYTLPDNSFVLNSVPYHVPCVFQIWERNSELPNLREVRQPSECSDFSFGNRSDSDIFVFGAAPTKIIRPDEVLPTNRGYFLKSKVDIKELCDKIASVDWKAAARSSVSGGVAWFSRDEFVKHYINQNGA